MAAASSVSLDDDVILVPVAGDAGFKLLNVGLQVDGIVSCKKSSSKTWRLHAAHMNDYMPACSLRHVVDYMDHVAVIYELGAPACSRFM